MNRNSKIAVIGIGKWGKNLVREFSSICNVAYYCHTGNNKNAAWLKRTYPNITAVSHKSILEDETIDAVIIATPIRTHAKLAKKALLAHKHVFVEKPLASNMKDARMLVSLARKCGKVLFVGHVFLFHPVFLKIKEKIKKKEISYIYSTWNKFGTFKENIIHNLLSHEISLAIETFGIPKKISIVNVGKFITDADVLVVRLLFDSRKSYMIFLNRISIQKQKLITYHTNKRVLSWEGESLFELTQKSGEFRKIYTAKSTSLKRECIEFLDSIKNNKKNRHTDGTLGLQVVSVLEQVEKLVKSSADFG